jgi:hypothetical protein
MVSDHARLMCLRQAYPQFRGQDLIILEEVKSGLTQFLITCLPGAYNVLSSAVNDFDMVSCDVITYIVSLEI